MSTQLSKTELQKLVDKSVEEFSNYLNSLISSDDCNKNKRASLISYWATDYVKYLKKEKTFTPPNYKYSRGDIVLVNFGYRVGCELGGMHFAIVVDNFNSKKSPIMTVVPLSSKKKDHSYNETFSFELSKGVYELYMEKREKLLNSAYENLNAIAVIRAQLDEISNEADIDNIDQSKIKENIRKINDKIKKVKLLDRDLDNLKNGTIVAVSQITTISKLRIINPKSSKDSLYDIKLNTDDLDKLNDYIKKLYIFEKQQIN